MKTQPNARVGRFVNRLPPDINLYPFQAAWNSIVEANSILRTRLIQNDLGAFQAVVKRGPEFLSYNKLDTYLRANLAEAMGQGSPLVRVAMIQPEEESCSHVFALAIHHALFDHLFIIVASTG